MNTSIKDKIQRGKKAFDAYLLSGDDGIVSLAKELGISKRDLKLELNDYINRVIEPKPSIKELEQYNLMKDKGKSFQTDTSNTPEVNSVVIREQEAFTAFLNTINNPSALVDLALKQGINPERVRINAFNYAKRTEHPCPSTEELNIFNTIHQMRNESVQKERIDFKIVDDLISLKSVLVNDYLELVIKSDLKLDIIINKIDLYIKHNNQEIDAIKKLSLIKRHLEANKDFINEEKRIKSHQNVSKSRQEQTIEKVRLILQNYLINSNSDLKTHLNSYGLSEETFMKYLNVLKEIGPEDHLLVNEYYNRVNEDKKLIADSVKLIYSYLTNGIEKNGEITKFNVLDYYRIMNMKPEKFVSKARSQLSAGDFSRIELNRLIQFFNAVSHNTRLSTEEELLTYNISYNNLRIEDEETKRKIIVYLNILDIPLYLNVYYTAAEEYLKGHLNLNSNNYKL